MDSQGQPFKNSSCQSVKLSSNDIVDDFRDAVKAENPNKLSSVDASSLLVYKNLDSFMKKEEFLEEDTGLDELGSSKKDALIVLVNVFGTSTFYYNHY